MIEPVYLLPYPVGPTNTISLSALNLNIPGVTCLILFGTGFDAATAGNTTAVIQGVSVPVNLRGTATCDSGSESD